MSRLIAAFSQFFDGAGDPLENGWLEFLVSGTNNSQKNTYYDSDLTLPNSNPLQLDAEGRCPSTFGRGVYKVKLYTNNPSGGGIPGTLIQEFDPVAPAGEDTQTSGVNFGEWDSNLAYSIGDIVVRNLIYYQSFEDVNLNNAPETNDDKWEIVEFLRLWNTNITYNRYDTVVYEGQMYASLLTGNIGRQPDTTTYWWENVLGLSSWNEIGSAFAPLSNGYHLGTTTRFIGNIYQGDNNYHYFGNSQDAYIGYDGSDFIIHSGAGDVIIQAPVGNEIKFHTHSSLKWTILDAGHFEPASDTYNLGSSTHRINNIYHGDSGTIYFGDSQDARIYHNTVAFTLQNDTGTLDIKQNASAQIRFYTSGSLVWRMDSSGNFVPDNGNTRDIGSTSSRVKTIYTINALDISDYRLKENIKTSDLGLDFISQLNPVKFTLKEIEEDRTRYGLIAQEVNSVLNSLGKKYDDFNGVAYDEDEDMWNLGYTEFIAPMIKAIQELKQEVENLKNG